MSIGNRFEILPRACWKIRYGAYRCFEYSHFIPSIVRCKQSLQQTISIQLETCTGKSFAKPIKFRKALSWWSLQTLSLTPTPAISLLVCANRSLLRKLRSFPELFIGFIIAFSGASFRHFNTSVQKNIFIFRSPASWIASNYEDHVLRRGASHSCTQVWNKL